MDWETYGWTDQHSCVSATKNKKISVHFWDHSYISYSSRFSSDFVSSSCMILFPHLACRHNLNEKKKNEQVLNRWGFLVNEKLFPRCSGEAGGRLSYCGGQADWLMDWQMTGVVGRVFEKRFKHEIAGTLNEWGLNETNEWRNNDWVGMDWQLVT